MSSRTRLGIALIAGLILIVAGSFALTRRANAPSPLTGSEVVLGLEEGASQLLPGLYVLEVESGIVRHVLDQPGYEIGAGIGYEWSEDGEWLLGSSGPGRIVAVRSDGGESKELEGVVWNVSRLDDGTFILHMLLGRPGEDRPEVIARLDIDSMTVTQVKELVGSQEVRASPDGRFLAEGGQSVLDVHDLESGERRMAVEVPQGDLHWPEGTKSVWSPDSSRLVVVDYADEGALVLVDPSDGAHQVRFDGDIKDAAWSPDGSRLAYTAIEYEEGDVFVTSYVEVRRADGTGEVRRLGLGTSAAWSPGGRAVAFVRDGAIWRVDLQTGDEQRLVSAALPLLGEPRWSPDGRFLAFRAGYGGGNIYAIDAAGGSERRIGPGDRAVWSPDGERIAFIYITNAWGGTGGIATMRSDGSEVAVLGEVLYSDQPHECTGQYFSWSPDSDLIAYATGDEGALFVAPADGSTPAKALGQGLSPTWSPDSNRLIYSAEVGIGGNCNLYESDREGRLRQFLTDRAKGPHWSPDGRWVFESDFRNPTSRVAAISPADRTAIRQVGSGWSPRWSPDSSRLAYYRPAEVQGSFGLRPESPGRSREGWLVVEPFDGSSEAIEIPVQGVFHNLDWSPDGKSIVFSLYADEELQVIVVELSRPDDVRRLGLGRSPSWSPDGKTIIYSRYR